MSKVYLAALAIMGVACLVASLAELRKSSGRNLPIIAVVVVGGGAAVDSVAFTGSYLAKAAYPVAVITALALAAAFRSERSHGHSNARSRQVAALAMGLWAWLAIVDLASNTLSATTVIARFLPGAMWLTLILAKNRATIDVRSYALASSIVLSVVALSSLRLEDPFRPCDRFKCGILGALFTGPFESENYLAMQSSVAAVLAIIGLRGVLRASAVALDVAILIGTGSRTAMLALGLTLALAVLAAARDRERIRPTAVFRNAGVAAALAAASPALGLYLVYHASPTDFSDRGGIWLAGTAALQSNFSTGLGLDRWYAYQQAALVPGHFPHSTSLLLVFAGGVPAVVLFTVWLYGALRAGQRNGRGEMALAVGSILVISSLTEVVWNPLTIDGLTWIALLVCSVGVADAPATNLEGAPVDLTAPAAARATPPPVVNA